MSTARRLTLLVSLASCLALGCGGGAAKPGPDAGGGGGGGGAGGTAGDGGAAGAAGGGCTASDNTMTACFGGTAITTTICPVYTQTVSGHCPYGCSTVMSADFGPFTDRLCNPAPTDGGDGPSGDAGGGDAPDGDASGGDGP